MFAPARGDACVDGQPSACLPVTKQGGDTNAIAVVDGVKMVIDRLLDVPPQLKADVVFDQSLFVRRAIEMLLHEGEIGLGLTAVMVFAFLGSFRATAGVFLANRGWVRGSRFGVRTQNQEPRTRSSSRSRNL